jgi:CheY-like chemotaxis protein
MYVLAGDSMPLSVLIVDATQNGLGAARETLKSQGGESIWCSSAAGALMLLSENPTFDVVVFATTVTDMDPAEFCDKMKAIAKIRHIPVIVAGLSHASAAALMDALASGAAGLVHYDGDPGYFVATLKSIASKRVSSGANGGANGLDGDLKALLSEYSALSHAVNNPLQAILANTDLLTLRLPEDSPLLKYTQSICESGDRVSKMVFEASQKAKAILNRPG